MLKPPGHYLSVYLHRAEIPADRLKIPRFRSKKKKAAKKARAIVPDGIPI